MKLSIIESFDLIELCELIAWLCVICDLLLKCMFWGWGIPDSYRVAILREDIEIKG